MMANTKHLHELLSQDQEPFHLHDYIADRRCQLSKSKLNPISNPNPKPNLQLKTRKPTTNSFCNHACFFSFHDSPDLTKSPLFQFQSPSKSPNKVFLHIPARTAAILLDAAARIQKQSIKTKTETKNSGFGLFGSLFKRLKDRSSKGKKREIGIDEVGVSDNVSNNLRALSTKETSPVVLDDKIAYEIGFSSCSCNNSRLSSAGWSESNEEKSLDLETSCSSRSEQDLEDVERENGDFGSCETEKCFCASPLSPFRFTLLQSPSPGRRTPDFLSPVASPSRHYNEEKGNCETVSVQEDSVEVEEEKEQCSPVSVLDPPFEDGQDEEQEGDDYQYDDYDHECSYANVQRAKHQLLQKLRRFERLADLDPVELEKRMFEQESNGEDEDDLVEEEASDYENESYSCEGSCNELVTKVLYNSSLVHPRKIPSHMKRLVSDLVREENNNGDDSEGVTKRVCKRLDSWKEVERNTIDMMVEVDFRREGDGWKRVDQEQIKETGMEIEVAIFGLLMEELSEELISTMEGDLH